MYRLNDKNRSKQNFKTHHALQKNQWTPILAEHFWIHTQLPCCISFQRAHVYPHGNTFVTVIGRCSVCNSHFKGVILNQPSENARYFLIFYNTKFLSLTLLYKRYSDDKYFQNFNPCIIVSSPIEF